MRTARLTAALGRSVTFLIATFDGLGAVVRGAAGAPAELTPGELLVFMTYLKNAFRPVRDLAKYTGRLVKATAAGERVIHLLEQTPEVRDLPGGDGPPVSRGRAVPARSTSSTSRAVGCLNQIDFRVQPGQHVALVGRSGIGKSTLASLFLRLYDPTDGRVCIDGRDIREYTLSLASRPDRRGAPGYAVVRGHDRREHRHGRRAPVREEIEAAARLANAHEFIEGLPQGYDTLVGERGVTLSGGQRQRIASPAPPSARPPS